MMAFLKRMFSSWEHRNGDVAADKAFAASSELIQKMRSSSASNDVWRAVAADIFLQRHNVPYMTTVFEATQEMNAAADQARSAQNAHNDNAPPTRTV